MNFIYMVWWDCWLLELELNKNHFLTADMAAKLCTPKHQVQCMRITNTPRKKRESLLCEVVCQPLREKDWATRRRTDESERQRRRREQSTTVPATEWQGETESEISTSRERERLRVRGRDWSLNLVFFFSVLRWFKLCVPEAAMVDTYGEFKANRVHWTRFPVLQNEFNELDLQE